jgi:hypothetical protein
MLISTFLGLDKSYLFLSETRGRRVCQDLNGKQRPQTCLMTLAREFVYK